MDGPADNARLLAIRFRPLVVFGTYVVAVAFGVLTIGQVWLVASGEDALAVLFALAVPLTGFVSVMALARAMHSSRKPYLVVHLHAGKITAIRSGRRRIYQLGPGSRFAIEYGHEISGESFISGERIVIIRSDGGRSPTDLWSQRAHQDDWATLARML